MKIGQLNFSKINLGYEARLTAAMFVVSFIWLSASNKMTPVADRVQGWDFLGVVVGGYIGQWFILFGYALVATMFEQPFTGHEGDFMKNPLKAQFYSTAACFLFAVLYWCKAYGVFAGGSDY